MLISGCGQNSCMLSAHECPGTPFRKVGNYVNATPTVNSSQLPQCDSDRHRVGTSNDIRTKQNDVSKSM